MFILIQGSPVVLYSKNYYVFVQKDYDLENMIFLFKNTNLQ